MAELEDLWGSVIGLVLVMLQKCLAFGTFLNMVQYLSMVLTLLHQLSADPSHMICLEGRRGKFLPHRKSLFHQGEVLRIKHPNPKVILHAESVCLQSGRVGRCEHTLLKKSQV